MIYGSVCSGIESASMAWEPLGMNAVWFSEIEAFPSAVLDHHWPHVPNLGDMRALPGLIRAGLVVAPDALVGGTPCQAFSVAGLREGMEDERGQLTLTYVDILNAIDEQRRGQESACVWENVPGVLSSKDNAFGCFLAALCGEDEELRPTGKRWSNAGAVFGPQRAVAWRILDAQYFGVAQRRRRVFVVASARAGFDPTKVLFESEGLRRDIKPSRETGSSIAKGTISRALTAHHGRLDPNEQTFITCFDARQDPNIYGEIAGPCSASFPPNAIMTLPIHDKTTRHAGKTGKGSGNGLGVGKPEDPSFTLTTGDNHAVFAFKPGAGAKAGSIAYSKELSPTLTADDGGQRSAGLLNAGTVRRLTPVECERLQGFPDGHTLIEWRGKKLEDCPDGPRYKAIGNSKAVPVIRWVGKRLLQEMNRCKALN